jgi:uncharacterized membrane protein
MSWESNDGLRNRGCFEVFTREEYEQTGKGADVAGSGPTIVSLTLSLDVPDAVVAVVESVAASSQDYIDSILMEDMLNFKALLAKAAREARLQRVKNGK